MRIEPLDPTDDATFDEYVRISRTAQFAWHPHATPFQGAELRRLMLDHTGSDRCSASVGWADGAIVAAGQLSLSVADNLDKAELDVWVDPSQWRRGYGTEMLEHVIGQATDAGRTTLIAMIASRPDLPDSTFLTRLGFSRSNVDVHRVLDLPVPGDHLERLEAEAGPHHGDYRFVDSIGSDLSDDLLPSYLALTNSLLADAPTGDVEFEVGRVDPDTWRADQTKLTEMGREMYRTIAIAPDGAAAAYTLLVVPRHDPGIVFQWGTLVAKEHRGHRLGLAVKARNIRQVQRAHPDRTAVHTWNADSNTWMIAVNERLGFRVVGASVEYVRTTGA